MVQAAAESRARREGRIQKPPGRAPLSMWQGDVSSKGGLYVCLTVWLAVQTSNHRGACSGVRIELVDSSRWRSDEPQDAMAMRSRGLG